MRSTRSWTRRALGPGWQAAARRPRRCPMAAMRRQHRPRRRPFLLEVGVEELPVDDLDAALAALSERLPALLAELRLEHGRIDGAGHAAAAGGGGGGPGAAAAGRDSQVVGPPVKAAYDAEGRPTRAAEGFAKSAGVAVGDLTVVDQKGEERVAAVRARGRPTGRRGARGARCRLSWPACPSPVACAGMPAARPSRGRCAGWWPCTARPWCR